MGLRTACNNLPASFSSVLELVGQNVMEADNHILTCRLLHPVKNLMERTQVEMAYWVRIIKVLSPAVLLEKREDEQFNMYEQGLSFNVWLYLASFFRESLVL